MRGHPSGSFFKHCEELFQNLVVCLLQQLLFGIEVAVKATLRNPGRRQPLLTLQEFILANKDVLS